MNFFLWTGVILFVFLILIMFTSVRIEILFKHEHVNEQGEIRIRALLGLVRLRFTLPQLNWRGWEQGLQVKGKMTTEQSELMTVNEKVGKRNIRSMKKRMSELLSQIDDFMEVVRWFFSKITCEKLDWSTSLGTGDAAEAGILTGLAWSIKSMLIGWISGYIRWKQYPNLSIRPAFQQKMFDTYFHSIIRFRLGYAILALKRLFIDRYRRRSS